MAFIAAATLSAQPVHNDTLRTNTWSLYLHGGVSGAYGARGADHQYDMDKTTVAPFGELGVYYNLRPWMRLGLGAGYSYMKSNMKDLLTESTSNPDFVLDGHHGTMNIDKVRIQNKNFTNFAFTNFTMGFNLVEIWRTRGCQWFNLWLTEGVGYMHGWNNHASTWAIDENFISDDHTYDKTHSSITSPVVDSQFDDLYVPVALSMEFDIIPQLTLGVFGQFNHFPKHKEHTPAGMWAAGVTLAFNIVGEKQGFKSKKREIEEMQEDIKYYTASNEMLNSTVNDLQVASTAEVVDGIIETDVHLGKFAVQIYAFKKIPHAPDDKIFYGDNPAIYRDNTGMRRYVLFTDSLEEARVKLQRVRYKYYDAFIVTIDDDGNVIPFELPEFVKKKK